MPLFKGKKNIGRNIEIEEKHGKPHPQALAIALSVARKKPKKKASGGSVESGSKDMNYAEGGMVNESARSERRPMPEERDKDAAMVSRNSGNKPAKQDSWTDQPTVKQAMANSSRKVMPIKQPKMVPSNSFSVRMRDEEDHLEESASPGPYDQQPPEHDNEEGPDRQGPKVSDMEHEHSNGRKPYAKGGMINEEISMKDAEEDHAEHPAGLEQDDDQMAPKESDYMEEHDAAQFAEGGEINNKSPWSYNKEKLVGSEDEKSSYIKRMKNEENAARLKKEIRRHSDETAKKYKYADGGMAHEMDDQPLDEEELEHAASIAAAIMAKRRRMAEGGEINEHSDANDIHSKDSIYSDDSDQADLSRNADEDANEEDQLSYDALRKENYNESEGLVGLDSPEDSNLLGDSREDDAENDHDKSMVSAIRRKMKIKSAISK